MDPVQLKDLLSEHLIPDLSSIVLDYMDIEIKFLRQWGQRGSGEGEFICPGGIAVLPYPDGRREIFVADIQNHLIQVFTPEGKFLRRWGRRGVEEGEFNFPNGTAVLPLPDGGAEIIVVDTYNHRIQMFTPEGKFLRQWGQRGIKKGEFNAPIGIAVLSCPDGRREIFVADIQNHLIQVFSSDGKFLRRWGQKRHMEGEFIMPEGVAVLPLPDGGSEIIVTSGWNDRIHIFTPEGKFLRRWGRREAEEEEFIFPNGTAVLSLPNGRRGIIVSDSDNHRIQMLSSDRDSPSLCCSWGREGSGEGEFNRPGGTAILSCPDGRDEIIVADVDNHRVQVFGLFLA